MIQEREQQQLRRIQDIRNRVRHQQIDPIYKPKSQTDQQFILSCLKNHFVFYNLSQAELANVRDSMWWTEIPSGLVVFRQGNPGTCFFIIASGLVEVEVDNQPIKTLKSGQGFGELALLYEIDRPSTVKVKESVGLWVLDKISFKESVEEIVIKQFQQTQKYLEGLSFYQFLKNREKEKVASSFVTLKYYKGQNIIDEGDPGSAFYIIKNGTASLIQGSVQQRKIYKGESFGVNSLYYNTMRKMAVRADDQVTCQVLGRQTLAKIIGQDVYRQTMFKNYVKFTMQKNRQLFMLIKRNEEKVFENLKTRYYKANQVVFKKGSIVHKLLVIMEGKIKKFRSANFLAQSGQTWGQIYLRGGSQTRLQDDIITETESVLIELNLDNLRNIYQQIDDIKKPERRKIMPKKGSLAEISYIGRIQSEGISSIHYLKFEKQKLIGKLYNLAEVQKQNMLDLLKSQITVAQDIQHPFIPLLQQIVEQKNHIMLIFDHISGESLYDVIRDIGLLSTSDSQFYAASMILLLQHLANQEVVIRDLKPDNFIVDQKGFLHLISFGSAKSLKKIHKTSTIVGTPHYMAPEVVLGKDYNELVDLWAVGVILYEFMVGQLPFGSLSQNPYEIYQEIIQGDVGFPRNFKDRRAKKVIESMLSLNPEARHNGSFNNLKNNTWFQNVNWDQLYQKSSVPAYKPLRVNQLPQGKEISLQTFFSKLG